MIRQLILICSLFVVQVVLSQTKNNVISVSFNNKPLKEVVLELERESSHVFFFKDEWLKDIIINETFTEKPLNYILDRVFRETSINYIIYNSKVILSNNNVVYNSLPKGYFPEELDTLQINKEKENENETKTVVFYEQFSSQSTKDNPEIITIGKQNSNSKSYYTLTGKVNNLRTNEPLQNLVISVQNKSINAVTDEKGIYSIKLPVGYNSLETRLLGHKPEIRNIIIYGDGSLNFLVSEDTEELSEVLIVSKRNDNVKSVISGVTRIDVADIKTIPLVLGERDILKVAVTLPGIKTAGEGSSGFNVRGGRTDQNLILLDDAVIYNSAHFLGFFTALNPFTTGSLDIYKASIPVQYGGRLSSVFDIKTKDGNMEKLSGEGSIGPVTANLAVETPVIKNKSSLTTGFRATYSDWVLKTIKDEESLKNSQASFFDGVLKYTHKFNDKNRIQSTIYYSKDKFSISSDSVFNYSNLLGSIKWDHTFNGKNRGSVIVSSSQYKYDIDYEGDRNLNFDFGYNINETQLKLNMKYLYNKKHKFDYGFNSKLYKVNPGNIKPKGENSDIEALSLDEERGIESAIYISDLYEISNKFLLDIGLRYSFYSALGPSQQNAYINGVPKEQSTIKEVKTYGNNEFIKTYGGPEARVSIRYLLTPELSLKASYNNLYQYIHLLSNNTTESPTDAWKLSDLNIKPQRSEQFSLGIYKDFNTANIEISLEGYYKKMKDILDYKIGADLILNEDLERELLQGEGKAYGIEFLIKKKNGKLNGWLSYSYSRSFTRLANTITEEQVNDGDYFPANYDKPHDFTVIANYKLTHRYSFSANFTYQTGRPITYPIGKYIFANEEQVVYSDRNKYRIPDYYRLDLGINIEGNHKIKKLAHSFWNISVYNVLGRNNPYSIFFENENGKIQAYKTSIFGTPIPTITYNFKF